MLRIALPHLIFSMILRVDRAPQPGDELIVTENNLLLTQPGTPPEILWGAEVTILDLRGFGNLQPIFEGPIPVYGSTVSLAECMWPWNTLIKAT